LLLRFSLWKTKIRFVADPTERKAKVDAPAAAPDGRDELNLAEFPLTALSHRAPANVKKLVFTDRIRDQGTGELIARRLTVLASEEFGLPTSLDDDVLVGLIQLTKRSNNFSDRTVPFSRYALIELLGWPDNGQSYARVEESLKRWLGVTLLYERAWWDKEEKAWVDEHFHIIDNVTLHDLETRARRRRQGNTEPSLSSFSWNRVVFRSFQAENVKRLDLKLYFELHHAPAKRAFRFLDKRFYRAHRLEFDLREFACEHVGLSRKYDIGKIKEKLEPSLRELEEKHFLEPLRREERYVQLGRGVWRVIFIKGAEAPKRLTKARAQALERQLRARGVTETTATELIARFPTERIAVKLEVFDWLRENGKDRLFRNPPGYLVKSIEEDYAPPTGFETSAARAGRARVKTLERERVKEEQARARGREEARREAEEAPVLRYWNSLPPPEQEALKAEALSQADPWLLTQYERCLAEGNAERAANYLQPILDKHIFRLLEP
jgi:plasmid replication initiation protein